MNRGARRCVAAANRGDIQIAAVEDPRAAPGAPVRRPRSRWRETLRRALFSGSIASLTSALALAIVGKGETGSAATPLNGPSQWVLGRQASYRRGPAWPHTGLGYAVHHAMSIFWALPFEHWRGEGSGREPGVDVAAAASTAALACFVDYRLTPDRFTPGFQRRLSRPSLFVVYAAFALGLVLACGHTPTAAPRERIDGGEGQ
jgi:hypothetical protein